MEYGFVGQLYKLMRTGDTASFRRMLADHPKASLNLPADGSVAPVLISAVFTGRNDYLEELLAAGADPNLRDLSTKGAAHNMRALHAAYWFNRLEMVETLHKFGAEEDFGTRLFARDIKAVKQYIKTDKTLLASAFIRSTFTLLHVTAELGDIALTRFFVDQGLDPAQPDGDGHSALRYAARNYPALDVMEVLVNAGADVNAASKTGITALSAACSSNESLEAVIWLLNSGADPNLVPKDRNSPLLRATRLKNTEMVRALLEAGADPLFIGKGDETASRIAKKKNAQHILKLIVQYAS